MTASLTCFRLGKYCVKEYENIHKHNLSMSGNLKAAKDSAAVGDRTNSTCKSQKADGWQDVAVDELPEFLNTESVLIFFCVREA